MNRHSGTDKQRATLEQVHKTPSHSIVSDGLKSEPMMDSEIKYSIKYNPGQKYWFDEFTMTPLGEGGNYEHG